MVALPMLAHSEEESVTEKGEEPHIESVAEKEDGLEVIWEKAGADFVDLYRADSAGGWERILKATSRTSVSGLDGGQKEFQVRNPAMWLFRSVAKDVSQYSLTSISMDSLGLPAICFQELSDTPRIRLATLKGLKWVSEVVVEAQAIDFSLVHLPDGSPLVAFCRFDGELQVAGRKPDGNWEIETIGRSQRLSLAVSPAGIATLAFIEPTTSQEPARMVFAQKTQEGWVTEEVGLEVDAQMVGTVFLSFAPAGQPGIAFSATSAGKTFFDRKTQIHLIERTSSTWEGGPVLDGAITFSFAYDSQGIPGIAFQSREASLEFASPVEGKWKRTLVDPVHSDWIPSLAFGPDGGVGILYQDQKDTMKVRSKYATFDGMGWHTQTLWTEGGQAGQSIDFDSAGYPAISFLSEKGNQLRYGRIVPLDAVQTKDSAAVMPVIPPKELAVEGKKLTVEKANVLGTWRRQDPTEPGQFTEIVMTASGSLSHTLGGGLTGNLPADLFRHQGTFEFQNGIITGIWEQGDIPLAVLEGEGIKFEIVSVTATHLEIRFNPGHPTEVFEKK